MAVSSHFDIETCLARIRRDKASVIRLAFNAGAMCIVQATSSSNTLNEDDDAIEVRKVDDCTLPVLQDWKCLEALRTMSLERARENKENKLKAEQVSSTTNLSPSEHTPTESKRGPPSNKGATIIAGGNSDSRALISRAVLCSAASIAFNELTPGPDLDHVNVPQNTSTHDKPAVVNMGAVVLQALTLGNRAAALAKNAARRSQQRQDYRKDNAASQSPSSVIELENPFQWKDNESFQDAVDEDPLPPFPFNPNPSSLTSTWKSTCRPWMQQVLESGHTVFYDAEWKSRHGRIADFLQSMADTSGQYGPHLIVTTTPNVKLFAQEMDGVGSQVSLGPQPESSKLRVLSYIGSKALRRFLRKHWSKAHGLKTSSFHVLVTSYSSFLEDYLHFCQQPWQVALLDDGYALLAAAQSDPNSLLGQLWEEGIFSCNDQHIGIAGTSYQAEWDVTREDNDIKTACIGLTVRRRILTTCQMWPKQKDPRNLIPEPGLLRFLMPNFVDVIKDEWDRSKLTQDIASVEYLRKLLARCVVVHCPEENQDDMLELAIMAMCGELPQENSFEDDAPVPMIIPDEIFVGDGKISQSRRLALSWLGTSEFSWLRYELGVSSFKSIIDSMKQSTTHGHICEEVLTASSTTSSGVGGAVTGTLAYRFAVRCCRSFGSEQGLRQHQAAQHSPPGTWLCRTCGSDCGTSQARTHHERSCGQPIGSVDDGSPPEGEGKVSKAKQHGPVGVVGKKTKGGKVSASAKDKDPDGSFRVPGYRGVWVNPAGKHFVKIRGKSLTDGNSEDVVLLDSVELAARMHDDVINASADDNEVQLNFMANGTRIPYEENSTAALAAERGVEMLGGGSSSVVPALSIINIKDLPKHVKPLLRDPRQTSRTGGNSKRHVYAYRGVCRQARKGHDRWQSQISFNGCNHYLGTFDSEWDAAAVYAWAHLILYGEEATKKAQQEGEEAAAAYEQEKDAIGAGEIFPVAPKAEKKKAAAKKIGTGGRKKKPTVEAGVKRVAIDNSPGEKKAKTHTRPDLVTLAKSVSRAPVLGPKPAFATKTDEELAHMVAERLAAVKSNGYCVSFLGIPLEVDMAIEACIPVGTHHSEPPCGGAMLLGLSPILFGWNPETFASMCDFESQVHELFAVASLAAEYEKNGYNERFRTVLQSTHCIIGRAGNTLEKICREIGFGPLPLGGPVGKIDCHLGGMEGTCTENAAIIEHLPSQVSDFQFRAGNSSKDVVTVNGKRITSEMGSFPLFNEDVCTVGARVFVFLLPSDT